MTEIKEVVWRWEYGVYVPFCPYCDEPAYYEDHCFACNRQYKYVEGEHKPTKVSKGEWTAIQATNNHASIYKNGRMVMHSECNEKKTEEQLLAMVDRFIRFSQSGAIEDLFADESED